ncbi:MAG: helix-turn-helix domain-containing protein [Symploca sp. SIO3E6]|nr:helix-turn-helix domain-containing protein [Caldora sp. SIO3E6]
MGRGRHNKVLLHPEQRQRLEDICHNGYASAKKILHANVLLMSDESEKAPARWTDGEIADALGIHQNTVARIRKRFLQQGIELALNRSPRLQPPVPAKIDG